MFFFTNVIKVLHIVLVHLIRCRCNITVKIEIHNKSDIPKSYIGCLIQCYIMPNIYDSYRIYEELLHFDKTCTVLR